MQTVKLTYFKDSGKYYSGGELSVSPCLAMFQIFEHVQRLVDAKTLPGLIPGAQFITLVEAPGHENEYPGLIFPKKERFV